MAGGAAVAPRQPIAATAAERPQLALLHGLVEHTPNGSARLIGPDGTEHELPHSVYELLVEVVHHLAQGHAVSVLPYHAQLTTQQAADLLGVSRPHLVKLLGKGAIPYERPGKHRRLKLEDVLTYQARQAEERRQTLDELAAESARLGLDY